MKFKNALSAERARELLSYDYETGLLTWLVSVNSRARAGDVAGCSCPRYRYIKVRVDGVQYLAHRVIFLWMTGRWPISEVDHKDMDRTNNRWSNLREATSSQNKWNTIRQSPIRTGCKGVRWNSYSWYATISANGKRIYLGSRHTREEAAALYAEAAREYHGEFARAG